MQGGLRLRLRTRLWRLCRGAHIGGSRHPQRGRPGHCHCASGARASSLQADCAPPLAMQIDLLAPFGAPPGTLYTVLAALAASLATASSWGSGALTLAHLRAGPPIYRRVAARAAMPSRSRRPPAQGASWVRPYVETAAQRLALRPLRPPARLPAPLIRRRAASSLALGAASRDGCNPGYILAGRDHTGLATPS
eukprot:scaffold62186_cov76-Phaeocystis_antarctica.AAC.4